MDEKFGKEKMLEYRIATVAGDRASEKSWKQFI